jgi:hypothetical protein
MMFFILGLPEGDESEVKGSLRITVPNCMTDMICKSQKNGPLVKEYGGHFSQKRPMESGFGSNDDLTCLASVNC